LRMRSAKITVATMRMTRPNADRPKRITPPTTP
jgi:hypothetical protein